jgi:hypothetical protein
LPRAARARLEGQLHAVSPERGAQPPRQTVWREGRAGQAPLSFPRTNTDNGGNCPEMSGATVSDRHLPFQSSRSRQSYRVVGGGADPVDGPLRPTARLSAIGTFARSTHARQANPLERYRSPEVRARDKPTVSPSGRSFATSTRATGARLKLCQAQTVGRFPAESYSLPILSFPLQPLKTP